MAKGRGAQNRPSDTRIRTVGRYTRRFGPTLAAILATIGLWELMVIVFQIPSFILPRPSVIGVTLWNSLPSLWFHALVTTGEGLAGLVLALFVSIPLAAIIAFVPLFERTLHPLIVATQAIPKIAIAPVMILWLGWGFQSKIMIAFLVCFFPLLIDTIAGLRVVDPDNIDLVRTMRGSRWRTFRYVRVPSALPHFFSGLKVAASLAVIGAIVGEFIAAEVGLGYRLLTAFSFLQTELMFAILVIMSLLGMLFYYTVAGLERVSMPWHVSYRSSSSHAPGSRASP